MDKECCARGTAARTVYQKGTPHLMLRRPTNATPRRRISSPCSARRQLLERQIADWIQAPVLVVEMPPLRLVHRESLRLHGVPQQVAVPTAERRRTGVQRIRSIRHLVIAAGHSDR